jgi:hypothetical protein
MLGVSTGPVVDSEIGRFEFSYVVRQIQNIELQV